MTAMPFSYKKVKPEGKWLEARVVVNQYLLFKVGTAFMAGEPEMMDSSQFILRVPIIYTGGEENVEVGSFLVKADTNQLLLDCCDSKENIYAMARIGAEEALSAES